MTEFAHSPVVAAPPVVWTWTAGKIEVVWRHRSRWFAAGAWVGAAAAAFPVLLITLRLKEPEAIT